MRLRGEQCHVISARPGAKVTRVYYKPRRSVLLCCSNKPETSDRNVATDVQQHPRLQLIQPSRRTLLSAMVGGVVCCPCAACQARASDMDSTPALAKRSAWYDSYFAYVMSKAMKSYEEATAGIKVGLFSSLASQLQPQTNSQPLQILEIGIGTGPNIQHLVKSLPGNDAFTLTGLDPNSAMQPYARQSADAVGLTSDRLTLEVGDAQSMTYPDNTFDAVVCTLVLCSVTSPPKVVQEVERVLKPGGKMLFMEHVAAWDQPLTQLAQDALTPLQQLLADGCHLNRNTGRVLQSAGFEQLNLTAERLPAVPSILASHVWGLATK